MGAVPYPTRLLHEDEQVLLDVRPHWLRLVGPSTVGVVVLAGVIAGFVSWQSAPIWFGYVLGGLLLVMAAYLAGKVVAWRSTNFVLTSSRVVYRKGVLHRVGREIPIDRVQDVTYHQRILERIVGAGSLVIESAGERGAEPMPDIRHPDRIQSLINKTLDSARNPLARPPADDGVVGQIERLADLHRRGVLTDKEFDDKKTELLERM